MHTQPKTVLVIPDAHVCPKQNLDRFKWVANLTLELAEECYQRNQELVVVQLGDWADWNSLSSHDNCGNYKKDLQSLRKSQELYHDGIQGLKVRKVFTEGNHGTPRLRKLESTTPALTGLMDPVGDALFEEHGWEVYPFLEPVNIGGTLFCHYYSSGVMGRAIGGRNMARGMSMKLMTSAVAGHSHVMGLDFNNRPDGSVVQTLSAGVFCDPNEKVFQSWNPAGAAHYWAGLAVLRNVKGGAFDPQLISLSALKRNYR
tara:strand:+ start:88 stop:861 length:774 start_codon:yes stop_codon:yes gene_type:complete